MTVKLGTNPIAWSNDDLPELGGDTPLETCLRETREAGFTGTEMGNKFPKQPDALKAKLGEFGLEFVSGWYSAELRTRTVEEEIRAMQPHLDLLAACGCKFMVFAETSGTVQGRRDVPVSDRPVMSEDEWPVYLDRIAKLSEYMAGKGVNLAFHHHMGTVIEKAAEVDRLLSGTPDTVGLLFDTGHFTFAGDDPAAVSKKWAKRINHVHTKDVRPDVMKRKLGDDEGEEVAKDGRLVGVSGIAPNSHIARNVHVAGMMIYRRACQDRSSLSSSTTNLGTLLAD